MQFTTLSTLAFADVPENRMSGANTLFNAMQQMAMGMGIALGAGVLRIAGYLDPNVSSAIPLRSFHIAFIIIGVVALIAVVDVFGLDRTAGDEVRRRKSAP
jgi:hypothetical protein